MCGCALLAVHVGLVATGLFAAQSRVADEYTVKAAFLYNFTRYIKWPGDAFETTNSPFVLGVFGEVPPELRAALVVYQEKKRVQGRTIDCRYFSDASAATGCHLVFVRNSNDDDDIQAIVRGCLGQSTLLVGESDSFLGQGGSISFTMADQKVGFRLALGTTTGRGLQPDAKLLRVAQVVE